MKEARADIYTGGNESSLRPGSGQITGITPKVKQSWRASESGGVRAIDMTAAAAVSQGKSSAHEWMTRLFGNFPFDKDRNFPRPDGRVVSFPKNKRVTTANEVLTVVDL